MEHSDHESEEGEPCPKCMARRTSMFAALIVTNNPLGSICLLKGLNYDLEYIKLVFQSTLHTLAEHWNDEECSP